MVQFIYLMSTSKWFRRDAFLLLSIRLPAPSHTPLRLPSALVYACSLASSTPPPSRPPLGSCLCIDALGPHLDPLEA